MWEQFDDMFMGIIYSYVQAMDEFVGVETYAWNFMSCVFLWLMFHVEMLVLGPKQEKSGEQDETINECVTWWLNFFRC